MNAKLTVQHAKDGRLIRTGTYGGLTVVVTSDKFSLTPLVLRHYRGTTNTTFDFELNPVLIDELEVAIRKYRDRQAAAA